MSACVSAYSRRESEEKIRGERTWGVGREEEKGGEREEYLSNMGIPFLGPDPHFYGLLHEAARHDDGVYEALCRQRGCYLLCRHFAFVPGVWWAVGGMGGFLVLR